MLRTLTIIENKKEDGTFEYSLSGDLPLDEAAKALVIVAFNARPTPTDTGTKGKKGK